jgi:hypothetical protein
MAAMARRADATAGYRRAKLGLGYAQRLSSALLCADRRHWEKIYETIGTKINREDTENYTLGYLLDLNIMVHLRARARTHACMHAHASTPHSKAHMHMRARARAHARTLTTHPSSHVRARTTHTPAHTLWRAGLPRGDRADLDGGDAGGWARGVPSEGHRRMAGAACACVSARVCVCACVRVSMRACACVCVQETYFVVLQYKDPQQYKEVYILGGIDDIFVQVRRPRWAFDGPIRAFFDSQSRSYARLCALDVTRLHGK